MAHSCMHKTCNLILQSSTAVMQSCQPVILHMPIQNQHKSSQLYLLSVLYTTGGLRIQCGLGHLMTASPEECKFKLEWQNVLRHMLAINEKCHTYHSMDIRSERIEKAHSNQPSQMLNVQKFRQTLLVKHFGGTQCLQTSYFQLVCWGTVVCLERSTGAPHKFGVHWLKAVEKLFWVVWLCF